MQDLNLNDVLVFVRVVEAGSLSEAARSLRTGKSTVSRSLTRLEATLGTQLLFRDARATRLTDAGEAYYARVSGGLGEVLEASSTTQAQTAVRGVVRVSAPPGVGTEVLPRLVTRFTARYPEVEVEVHLSGDNDVPAGSRYDVMVRGGPQPDSSLVIRKLRDTPLCLFASPEYLERAGIPVDPAALADHDCLLFRERGASATWVLHGPGGSTAVEVQGRVRSDGLSFLRRCAVEGAGIALLPDISALHAINEGLLAPVLPEYRSVGSPLFLLFPPVRHTPLRVTLFTKFLLEAFPSQEDVDERMFA